MTNEAVTVLATHFSALTVRVLQVWFQNARARNKKYIGKTRGAHPGALTSDTSIDLNLAFSAFYANHQGKFGVGLLFLFYVLVEDTFGTSARPSESYQIDMMFTMYLQSILL